jgi:hypothetical protein
MLCEDQARGKQRNAPAFPRERSGYPQREPHHTKEKPAAWSLPGSEKSQSERQVKNSRAGELSIAYGAWAWQVLERNISMFILQQATKPMPRYQTIQGACWSPRRFPWQKTLLALCQTPMTLAELAQATSLHESKLFRMLNEFCSHALVRLVAPM